MAGRDWLEWHDYYDQPGSSLRRRLLAVQDQIRRALDRCAPGPVRAVSLCAGQGRDLLPVLAGHPRGAETTALLVELDERIARVASDTARQAGLDRVRIVVGDASGTDAYIGAVPADIVIACGIFGNITDADIRRFISYLPQLCAAGATVIWTRTRKAPDITAAICRWFEDDGLDRLAFVAPPEAAYAVAAHRYPGPSRPLRPGERMFTFVGGSVLRGEQAWTDNS
jgi:hypothetical protein